MKRKNMFDKLFPIKYDFFGMLRAQAEMNACGVAALYQWLRESSEEEGEALLRYVDQADEVRKNLEKNLVEAFSTPFDRGDIYSVSISMDKVIEYAKSTLLSIRAYGARPNEIILGMTEHLKNATGLFVDAIGQLNGNPYQSERDILPLRTSHVQIEELYRQGMTAVFQGSDPMYALRQREIYHHIKDASSNMEDSVDVLHRIIVRLT